MGRKKIGDINYTPIIILGGIGILAYAVYKVVTGPSSNDQTNANIQANNNNALQNDLGKQSAAGEKQTLTNSQLSTLANNILQYGEVSGLAMYLSSSTMDNMVESVEQIGNTTDWLLLQQAFGTPNLSQSNFPTVTYGPCGALDTCQSTSLVTFLQNSLDSAHLETLNSFFVQQNINFQFTT